MRPLVDTGAMVFVVFGILGVNRTEHKDNHVIGDMVRFTCITYIKILHDLNPLLPVIRYDVFEWVRVRMLLDVESAFSSEKN